MIKKVIFAALTAALFAGFQACAGLPKITQEKNTLIMGRFHWIGDGSWTPSLKGTFSAAFGLSFRRVEDDKIYKVSTNNDGWFFLPVDKEGIYELVEFKREHEFGNTIYKLDMTLHRYFVVEVRKVCNLGDIEFHYEKDDIYLNDSRAYTTVRNDFKTKFEKSSWNQADWVNTKMRLGAYAIDNAHFVMDENFYKNDPRRFYWLWITWNNLGRQDVKKYPVPEAGASAEDWAAENLALVSGTELKKLSVQMQEDAPAKEYISLVRTGTKIPVFYILFNFGTEAAEDSILLAR